MELVRIKNKQIITSSLIVASVFEKRHSDVMRAIENLTGAISDSTKYFCLARYKDNSGKSNRRCA